MSDKWIAWVRPSHSRHGVEIVQVRLESEGEPRIHATPRPATAEEIAEEVARRAEREAQAEAERDLRERPEYEDAKAIHDVLEFLSPTNHPLDRLTREEWAEFRRKIAGEKL